MDGHSFYFSTFQRQQVLNHLRNKQPLGLRLNVLFSFDLYLLVRASSARGLQARPGLPTEVQGHRLQDQTSH